MEYSGIAEGDSNGGCDVLIIIQKHTMQFDSFFFKKKALENKTEKFFQSHRLAINVRCYRFNLTSA